MSLVLLNNFDCRWYTHKDEWNSAELKQDVQKRIYINLEMWRMKSF